MQAHGYDFVHTGFEPIDSEHREIATLLHELLDACAPGGGADARAAAKAVVEKVVLHFASEERLMLDHGYAQYARHKEAHDLFVADAARWLRQLDERGTTPAFRGWVTGRLSSWFRFHIAANDVALGHFLASARSPRAALADAEGAAGGVS